MARPKVGDLIPIGAIGSAKKGDVLEGKTYSSDEGVDLEGTMPNRGAINRIITTQNGQIVVPEGYHDGSGIVKAQFANLVPKNIKNGVNIGGIVGELIEGRKTRYGSGSPTTDWNFTIRNLPFTPSIIIAIQERYYYMYISIPNVYFDRTVDVTGGHVQSSKISRYNDGFSIETIYKSTAIVWCAIE